MHEYAFYSPPYKLHVRLDRFVCPISLQAKIFNTTYLGKTFTEYNLLKLTLTWGRVPTPVQTWRLQPNLLEDVVFKSTLAAAITTYFDENTHTASSPLIEWEAFKVVIQWNIYSHCSGSETLYNA